MKHLFHPSLYQFDQPQPSFWEASTGDVSEDPSAYFGYGYHGNGVNSATWSGRELAYWLAGKNASKDLLPRHLPAIMQGRPPRFPLAFLRRQYLRAGIGFYRLRGREPLIRVFP
jgi:hypothetical protein